MTDIAILGPSGGLSFDIFYDQNGFATDGGLKTAVTISLFTDRRLPDSVRDPEGSDDRRGYWGDLVESDGYQWGSLLWTLYRQVITAPVIASCREYCISALQWMIDDGIAETINVIAERTGVYQISIAIEIVKLDTRETLRYSYLWSGDVQYPAPIEEEIEPDPGLIAAIDRWYNVMNFTVPERMSDESVDDIELAAEGWNYLMDMSIPERLN